MALKNHLISLLALPLVHTSAVAAEINDIFFDRQHEASIDEYDGFLIMKEVYNENGVITTQSPSVFKINGPNSAETDTPTENFSAASIIEIFNDDSARRFDFKDNIHLAVHADQVSEVSVLSVTNVANIGSPQETLTIDVKNRFFYGTNAVIYGLQIADSTLNDETLPAGIAIDAYLETDLEDAQVQALTLFNSNLRYSGRLQLKADQTFAQRPEEAGKITQTLALSLGCSELIYRSAGQTLIQGDISLFDQSRLQLTLNHCEDRFIGKLYDNDTGNHSYSAIEVRDGAQWITRGDQHLNHFIWGKGGILEVAAEDPVGLNAENRGNTVEIEHGAVLRVYLTDADIHNKNNGLFKLTVGDASAKDSQNAQITVQVTDMRTDKADAENLNIGLIGTLGGTFSGIHAMAQPHRYENTLGEFETTAVIGAGDAGIKGTQGLFITAIETTRVGPSTLVKNMLDYAAFEQIRHEEAGFNALSLLSERIVNESQRGLWVDVSHRETRLELAYQTRKSEFDTQTVTLGYDRALQTGLLTDAFYGAWVSASQSDLDQIKADAKAESATAALYAGGVTDNGYRLILQAHYTWGKSEVKTPAVIDEAFHALDYDIDTESYGLGLYVGLGQANWGRFFIEPYMAGYTYWLKGYETSTESGIAFEAEKIHQSLAALGVHTSWRTDQLTLSAHAAWVHRFGQSARLTGIDRFQSEAFETEDLQESRGVFGITADWRYSDALHLKLRASTGVSEVVYPRYEIGVQARYLF